MLTCQNNNKQQSNILCIWIRYKYALNRLEQKELRLSNCLSWLHLHVISRLNQYHTNNTVYIENMYLNKFELLTMFAMLDNIFLPNVMLFVLICKHLTDVQISGRWLCRSRITPKSNKIFKKIFNRRYMTIGNNSYESGHILWS